MLGIFFLCLGYVMSQFYRSFLAVMAPILQTELSMDELQLSWASGAWFITFALAQFPIGYWLDKFGPRRTSSYLLLIGGGGGAMLFAFATTGWMIVLAMGLIGIGCAPVLMAGFYIFARGFSAKRFAVLSSTFIGVGTLGNIFGSSPLAYAIEAFGWREVSIALGLMTIAIALLLMVTVKDPDMTKVADKKGSLVDLLKIKQLWFIFPIVLLGYSVAAGIRGLWAGPFVVSMFSADILQVGQVTFYMALALTLGSFFYGPLDTMFNTRKWVVFVGNFLVLVALIILLILPDLTISNTTILFFVIGLFGANYAVLMAHGKSFVPEHLTGRGVTLLNFFSIGGTGLFQFITGATYSVFETNNEPFSGFKEMFIVYAIALILSLVIYLFAKDAKPNTN